MGRFSALPVIVVVPLSCIFQYGSLQDKKNPMGSQDNMSDSQDCLAGMLSFLWLVLYIHTIIIYRKINKINGGKSPKKQLAFSEVNSTIS